MFGLEGLINFYDLCHKTIFTFSHVLPSQVHQQNPGVDAVQRSVDSLLRHLQHHKVDEKLSNWRWCSRGSRRCSRSVVGRARNSDRAASGSMSQGWELRLEFMGFASEGNRLGELNFNQVNLFRKSFAGQPPMQENNIRSNFILISQARHCESASWAAAKKPANRQQQENEHRMNRNHRK